VIPPGGLAEWPSEDLHCTWRELEATPWAALFADVAPGPHVPVKLRMRGPAAGAEVVIRGTAEYGTLATNESSYRDAPTRVLQRIVVEELRPPGVAVAKTRVGQGPLHPDAASLGPRIAVLLTRAAALGCLCAAGYALMLVARLPRSPQGTLGCALMALAMVSLACVLGFEALPIQSTAHPAVRDDVLPWFPPGKDQGPRSRARLVGATLLLSVLGLTVPLFYYGGERLASTASATLRELDEYGNPIYYVVTELAVVSAISLLAAGAMAALSWATRRRSARLVRLLLVPMSEPKHLRSGAWATLEGRIEGRGPAGLAARHGYHVVIRGEDEADNTTEGRGETCPWQLHTAHGPIEVGAAGASAVWASSIIDRIGKKAILGKCEHTDLRLAPDGARALVAGRVSKGKSGKLSLDGGGAESLVFYASTEDARPMLRRRLRLHSALLALAVVAILVGLAGLIMAILLPSPLR
jgi:hypothetical protein